MRAQASALLASFAALLLGAAPAGAYVIGRTPASVALAATQRFAAHEVVAWNRPGVSYTLDSCHVLHRRPWVAYDCGFELHGVPLYCHGVVTVAVRRVAPDVYRAQEIRSRYVDDRGC